MKPAIVGRLWAAARGSLNLKFTYERPENHR